MRAMAKQANKFERIKNEKCGSRVWTEVSDLAQLIRYAWVTVKIMYIPAMQVVLVVLYVKDASAAGELF